MRSRRLTTMLVGGTVATALAWASLGTFTVEAKEKPAKIARAHRAAFGPSFKEPIFLLMLGSDARKGNPDHAQAGGLYDAIHIVAIDPTTKKASIVGVPRDSFVDIPGRGRSKINAAAQGGPDLMIRTIEDLSGCRFDYYTLVGFEGFRRIVDDLGGITYDVRSSLKDRFARIDVRPGEQVFDGKTALGWSRARHARPQGDFDRSREQGNLMVAALREARKDGARDPGVALRALGTLRRNLKLNIPLDEAFKLGLLMMQIDPDDVTNRVLSGEVGTESGQSIVRITDAGRNQLVDICDDGQLGS